MRRAVSASSSGFGAHTLFGPSRLPHPHPHPLATAPVGVTVPIPRRFHSKAKDGSEALGTVIKTTGRPPGELAAKPATRQRVSVADIAERRAKAGRLVAGTAAYSDTDMFKGPVRNPNPSPIPLFRRYLVFLLSLMRETITDAVDSLRESP